MRYLNQGIGAFFRGIGYGLARALLRAVGLR